MGRVLNLLASEEGGGKIRSRRGTFLVEGEGERRMSLSTMSGGERRATTERSGFLDGAYREGRRKIADSKDGWRVGFPDEKGEGGKNSFEELHSREHISVRGG